MDTVAPASTDEAAAVLRDAAGPVLFRGAGTKQDWGGRPRGVDLVVDTTRLTGVVEHAAGDLIVVVRAGTPLAELQDKLAPAGQQLALDDPLGATVGGTVAANTSGPRRMLYGTVRDLLIGITVVRADGVVAKAGGKVVKNVAGYDLGKLFTGSYGTLGLITECAFRLHPLPAATAVVTREVDTPAEVGRTVAGILAAQVVPSGIEVDSTPQGYRISVLVEGTPAGVAGRVATLGEPGPVPDWWGRYPWEPGEIGVKVSVPISGVPKLLGTARIRGSAGTGVLYAAVDSPDEVEALRAAAHAAGGHAVVLTAPDAVRDALDLWGPVPGLELMRRVKAQFDPDGRLAPGRFVGGI
jgi:glycolate oxidase FAD binding subunit